MKFGLTVLRATIGALMVGHGTQKLFGWFGGHGPDATGQAFESMGLAPGKRNAMLAGASEAGGGVLVGLGWLTPIGAAAITGTMATALRVVHLDRGPWMTEGGYEYNATIIAAMVAITDAGPGPWSLDAAMGRERWGTVWALGQLAAGAAGCAFVVNQGGRRARQQEQQAATSAERDGAGAETPTQAPAA
jgi:putative oxidoreductase